MCTYNIFCIPIILNNTIKACLEIGNNLLQFQYTQHKLKNIFSFQNPVVNEFLLIID